MRRLSYQQAKDEAFQEYRQRVAEAEADGRVLERKPLGTVQALSLRGRSPTLRCGVAGLKLGNVTNLYVWAGGLG